MVLPIDYESNNYKFYKTLNEDVKLDITSEKSRHYDIVMETGDYVNVSGKDSLQNAIVIAIMTRFNELDIPLYKNFGCRAHELIKAKQTDMVKYKIKLYTINVLESMRRIKEVNSVELIESDGKYQINYQVTSINDETLNGSVNL